MKKQIFSYGIRLKEDSHMEVFPAAEINVLGREGAGIRTLFHIDSGATTSMMAHSDAEALGLTVNKGRKMLVHGVTGDALPGYRHMVTFEFIAFKFSAPVIFVEYDGAPRILGREGIFPHFAILFDESKKQVAFLDAKFGRKTIDRLIK